MHKIQKLTPFLIFFILTLNTPVGVSGLGIGPPSLEIDVPTDGFNSTVVYVTSDGLSGELVIGQEGLPFVVEPEKIVLDPEDVNTPIEIFIHGSREVDPGLYQGKLTFIAMTGETVAMGIKIKIDVNLYDPKAGFSLFGLNQVQLLSIIVVAVAALVLLIRNRSTKTSEVNQKLDSNPEPT